MNIEQLLADLGIYVNVLVAIGTFFIIEAVKAAANEDKKQYLPILAVAVGIIANTALVVAAGANAQAIVEGVIAGAISGGFAVSLHEIRKPKRGAK